MSITLLRERAAAEGLPLGIVAAESLHVILLDALFAHPNSEVMAFQGGTCLHLVHGGYRYSEDLDLAGRDLDGDRAARIPGDPRPGPGGARRRGAGDGPGVSRGVERRDAAPPRTFRQADWVAALRSGKAVYRLGELARLAGHSEPAARQAARRLVERGWLARLGKALYANLLRADRAPSLEDVAAVLYPPCYVSLASALFAHGIAEQAPHVLTCVSTNKTKRFETGLGEVHYHQIKPELFFGYTLTRGVPRAEPEKAVLDTLYLELRNGRRPAIDEWNWEELDPGRLRSWADRYPGTVRDLLPAGEPSLSHA